MTDVDQQKFHEAHTALAHGAIKTRRNRRQVAAVIVIIYTLPLLLMDKPSVWLFGLVWIPVLYITTNWRWISGKETRKVLDFVERMREVWKLDYKDADNE